jgi:hypothetical protein
MKMKIFQKSDLPSVKLQNMIFHNMKMLARCE